MRAVCLALVLLVGCAHEYKYPPFVAPAPALSPSLFGDYREFVALDELHVNGPVHESIHLVSRLPNADSETYTFSADGCFFRASASGALSVYQDQLLLQPPNKLEGDDGLRVPEVFYIRVFGNRNILLSPKEVDAYDLFPSPLIGLVQEDPVPLRVARKSVHEAMKKQFGASYPPDAFSVTFPLTSTGEFLHEEIQMAPYELQGFICQDKSTTRTCGGRLHLRDAAARFSSSLRWVELIKLWGEKKSPTCQTEAATKNEMKITWSKKNPLAIPLPEGTVEDWDKHCDPKVRLAAFFVRLSQTDLRVPLP